MCYDRWEKKLGPRLNDSPWTKEEDDIILTMRKQAIPCRVIHRHLKSRTLDAIYQRCKDLGFEPKPGKAWSKEEIELLTKLVKEAEASGKKVKWTTIATQMHSERTAWACSLAWKRATAASQPKSSEGESILVETKISAVVSNEDEVVPVVQEDGVVITTDVCSLQEQHGTTTSDSTTTSTSDSKDQAAQSEAVIRVDEVTAISLEQNQDKIQETPNDSCTVVTQEAEIPASHDDKKDSMATTSTEAHVATATAAKVNEKHSVDKEEEDEGFGIIKFFRKLFSSWR